MAINTSTENYRQTLLRLKKMLLSSRFLRWWLGELSSMVPRQMRAASLDAESFPLVRQDGSSTLLRRFENGHVQGTDHVLLQALDPAGKRESFLAALERMAGGQRDVVLTLPPDRVLRKTLTLPLATEENLRQVLEFQMEEHTPFAASRLYFGYSVTGRDFEHGRLAVEFVASPRDEVDASIKTLNDWGATVRAVVAEETLAPGPLVNMLPAAQGKTTSVLWRGINPWLAGLAGVLALAAMAAPLLIKREAAVQLLPWLDKGKTAAEAADSLRRDLEARVDEHNYLLEKRQLLPPVIVALEELTRVLPDDTWVQQLDIKGKELQIQGETASSVRLIGLFEQSGTFYDASFRSPLTKGQTIGAERYQLALQMRPMTPRPQVGAVAVPAIPASAASAPVARAAAAPSAAAGISTAAAMAEKKP
ncbi:MAG: PilN domain-containing protein [Polaromonas sp.]